MNLDSLKGASIGDRPVIGIAVGDQQVWPRGPSLDDYLALVLADEPAAFWPMQEASGNLIDVTGNGHTLVPAGSGHSYGADGPVEGVAAVGVSGSGHWQAASAAAWSAREFTLEAWVRFDGTWGVDTRTFAASLASTAPDTGLFEWWVYLRRAGVAGAMIGMPSDPTLDGQDRWCLRVSDQANTTWRGRVAAPAARAWQHVAFVVRSNADPEIWLDAALVGQTSTSTPGTSRRSQSAGPLAIGGWSNSAYGYFAGELALAAFHTRALDGGDFAARVAALAG